MPSGRGRHNLVILCPDEMRADCAGFMGNRDIRTPNMDAFARDAVVFENYMTSFPKCTPARISLVTGRYCHTDGYRTVTQHMVPGRHNLLDRLRENGYQTAIFGKNHCWDPKTFEEAFDYRSYKPPYDAWLRGGRGLLETAPWPGSPAPLPLEDGWHYAGSHTRHRADEVYTAQAVDFLASRRDPARPFFLQVNIESPHPVYGVEEPWYSMYDRQGIRAWPHELPGNAPLPFVRQREVRTGMDPQPEAAREVQRVYYGMISKVDALMGRIFAAIEEQHLWEDTVILLWSDHGDFAGQYTLAEKWDTCFSDCLIHAPCVLRAPHLPQGLRVESLCDTPDLAPTLCDLLELEPLRGMHGQSLLPIIRGERRRDAVFADGGHEDEMLQRFSRGAGPRSVKGKRLAKTETYWRYPDTMARAKMVRTDRYKMVVRLRGGNELYDLKTDPWELSNRWEDSALAPVVPDLMRRLLEWSLRTDTDMPYQEGFTV